jgi:hypothetical protein
MEQQLVLASRFVFNSMKEHVDRGCDGKDQQEQDEEQTLFVVRSDALSREQNRANQFSLWEEESEFTCTCGGGDEKEECQPERKSTYLSGLKSSSEDIANATAVRHWSVEMISVSCFLLFSSFFFFFSLLKYLCLLECAE